jgi:isomerase DpgB
MSLVDEIVADPEEAARAAIIMLGRIAGTDLAIRRQLLAEALSVSYEDALGAHLAACDRELRRLDGRSGKAVQI